MAGSELVEGAERLGLCLTPDHIARLEAYLAELIRWSAKMSLTALDTQRALTREGLLDSLACAGHIPADARLIADIGSGAGFPAIPLAIVCQTPHFTLIEAVRKKTTFLRHVVRTVGLMNVTVWHGRAEEYDGADHEQFDVAFARAAAPLTAQAALAFPLLRQTGLFIAQTTTDKAESARERIDRSRYDIVERISLPTWIAGPGREILLLRRI